MFFGKRLVVLGIARFQGYNSPSEWFVAIGGAVAAQQVQEALGSVVVERIACQINAGFAPSFTPGQFVPIRVTAGFQECLEDQVRIACSDQDDAIDIGLKQVCLSKDLGESTGVSFFRIFNKKVFRKCQAVVVLPALRMFLKPIFVYRIETIDPSLEFL